MKTIYVALSAALLVSAIQYPSVATGAEDGPNIIFILADDMGVGDVSHTVGKAATPHIDRLAREGMRFTDAHSTSSVCTPTRYGVLTGRYNWRSRLKRSVFFDPHDAPLIEKDDPNVARLLKDNGYHTACIGKWHLGIGWQFLSDYKPDPKKKGQQGWDIDYSQPAETPTAIGFDYFYGIQASLDMAPYVYIKNEKAVAPGTVTKAFFRKGAASEDFEAVDCLQVWAEQSVAYLDRRAKEPEKPFFLYLPLTSPHTPIVPSPKWQGKSNIGIYGDFLMETDWVVGEVLGALDKHGMTGDTLVIFTTDNGCSPAAKIDDLVKRGHEPNGDLRGHKADIYEGGHRVPFVVRWPGVVKPGTETARLTCQTDFMATCADVIGGELDADAGVDSVSFLPTLKDPGTTGRDAIVHHSINGSFAIRSGKWKLCLCAGSGGWSAPRPGKEPEGSPPVQLFDLESDPAEKKNLAESAPDKVKELTDLLQRYADNGRSTPGPKQENDGAVNIRMGMQSPKKKK